MSKTQDRGVLITGFPGFIAGRLLARLVPERPEAQFYLLVQPKFVVEAQNKCREIANAVPELADRWHVISGDITAPDLGIDDAVKAEVRSTVQEVWHLAALYDLAVPQSIAHAVNFDGTRNVLDFCESLEDLRRLEYISTCYVAGDRTGRVREDELDCKQDFKNHYESTKFWAELEVQRRWGSIPTSVFRPAIVIGDSRTGETVKGDGPYVVVQMLLRLPRWLPMVNLGPSKAPVNLVPVDYVVEAMVRLSAKPEAEGKVFHLADPAPSTAREILALSVRHLRRAPVLGTVPVRVGYLLDAIGPTKQLLRLPRETLDYFNHPVEYDVSNTVSLLGGELSCPRFVDYWPTLLKYAREHPEIFGSKAA